MRNRIGSATTVIALLITLWLILSRLRFVVWVAVPWWGLLLIAVLLFLLIDFILGRIFRSRP
jgi:hypothetical protein